MNATLKALICLASIVMIYALVITSVCDPEAEHGKHHILCEPLYWVKGHAEPLQVKVQESVGQTGKMPPNVAPRQAGRDLVDARLKREGGKIIPRGTKFADDGTVVTTLDDEALLAKAEEVRTELEQKALLQQANVFVPGPPVPPSVMLQITGRTEGALPEPTLVPLPQPAPAPAPEPAPAPAPDTPVPPAPMPAPAPAPDAPVPPAPPVPDAPVPPVPTPAPAPTPPAPDAGVPRSGETGMASVPAVVVPLPPVLAPIAPTGKVELASPLPEIQFSVTSDPGQAIDIVPELPVMAAAQPEGGQPAPTPTPAPDQPTPPAPMPDQPTPTPTPEPTPPAPTPTPEPTPPAPMPTPEPTLPAPTPTPEPTPPAPTPTPEPTPRAPTPTPEPTPPAPMPTPEPTPPAPMPTPEPTPPVPTPTPEPTPPAPTPTPEPTPPAPEPTPTPTPVPTTKAWLWSVSYEPAGKLIASVFSDRKIKIWDVATGRLISSFDGNAATRTSFSPDGLLLAAGVEDNKVRIWKPFSGTVEATLEGHVTPVSGVGFSPDGKVLVTFSSDNAVKLWDTKTWKAVVNFDGVGSSSGGENRIRGVNFSPDGKTMVTWSTDQQIQVWDLQTRMIRHTLAGNTTEIPTPPPVEPDLPTDGPESPKTEGKIPGEANYNPPLVPVGYDFSSSPDYKRVTLYQSIKIKPDKLDEVNRIVDRGVTNVSKYLDVSKSTGVPWWVIMCLHNMEASGSFSKHLHEGSPLTARTKYVPKGRPLAPDPPGMPPFSWSYSAIDALKYDKLDKVTEWSLYNSLYQMERYNGLGYWNYHKDVNSPYLWSGSNHYTRGKYTGDGVWSSTAVSAQIGCAVILKRLEELNLVKIEKRG